MKPIFKLQLLLFAIFVFNHATVGQVSLVPKKFIGDRLQILVPKSFFELDKKSIEKEFPDSNAPRPTIMLIDQEGFTNLKIIEMPEDVSDNEVGEYKSFRTSNMKKEPDLEWVGDGYKKINGKNVGFIKVIYTSKKTFVYYFFTSLNGKLLLLSYDCARELWPAMEETVEKIVNSLKVE